MERLWEFRQNFVEEWHQIESFVCSPIARRLLASVSTKFCFVQCPSKNLFIRFRFHSAASKFKRSQQLKRWPCKNGTLVILIIWASMHYVHWMKRITRSIKWFFVPVCTVISHFNVNVIQIANVILFFKPILDVQPCRNSWNTNDCARFHELAVGRRFKIEIKDVRRADDNSYVTELTLIRPDQSNIGDILIQEQRAI